VYSPATAAGPCRAARCRAGLAQDRRDVLLDEVGLALLDHQHRALASQKRSTSLSITGIGHVHHVQRHARVAVHVGQAQPLEHAQQRVVAAALHDDADVVGVLGEELVERVLPR
jgi:hypothetical protein